MPSKNYRIGRQFEYRVQKYLRKLGYYVIRAYASKGLYDLIAIPPKTKDDWHNYPLMIQCKTNNYLPPDERKTMSECKEKWQGFQLVAFRQNRELKFRTLEGEIIKI